MQEVFILKNEGEEKEECGGESWKRRHIGAAFYTPVH